MGTLAWIIVFSLAGGLLSVLLAALFLVVKQPLRSRLIPHLVSFAIGTLLGAAFLGLLPHALVAISDQQIHQIFLVVLLGLLIFFLLEKLLLWRHCHSEHCEAHDLDINNTMKGGSDHPHQVTGTLIMVGDSVHNFIDGVLISAAFLTDFHLGVVTAVAIAAHEIPQEIGDFAVLLHSGFSRRKALLFNILSSLTTIVGAVLAYYSLVNITQLLPFILALAASSFIYIAVADLIPGLHKRAELKHTIQQLVLISLGVTVIFISHSTMH